MIFDIEKWLWMSEFCNFAGLIISTKNDNFNAIFGISEVLEPFWKVFIKFCRHGQKLTQVPPKLASMASGALVVWSWEPRLKKVPKLLPSMTPLFPLITWFTCSNMTLRMLAFIEVVSKLKQLAMENSQSVVGKSQFSVKETPKIFPG